MWRRELGRFGRLLLVTAGVYVAWHVLSHVLGRGAAGALDGERYAAVLFGPVMLLLFGAMRRVGKLHPRLPYLLLLLWLLYPAARVLRNAVFLRHLPVPALLLPVPAPASTVAHSPS